jgi:hypothetical protein
MDPTDIPFRERELSLVPFWDFPKASCLGYLRPYLQMAADISVAEARPPQVGRRASVKAGWRALAAQQHSLQNTVTPYQVVIQSCYDVQADERKQHVVGQKTVYVAGPGPTRRSCANQLR